MRNIADSIFKSIKTYKNLTSKRITRELNRNALDH